MADRYARQRAVAGESNATRAMDRVYALNTASFFDELFHSIRKIGAWPLLVGMDPQDRKGALYPFIQFVLVTIMRSVGGLQSALAMQEVLLTDEALMTLVGFNASQVQQGSNERGLSRRTSPCDIRGALSDETIADNIVKVGPDRHAALFNGVIRFAKCASIRCSVAPAKMPGSRNSRLSWSESVTCPATGERRTGRARRPTQRTSRRS